MEKLNIHFKMHQCQCILCCLLEVVKGDFKEGIVLGLMTVDVGWFVNVGAIC